MHKTPLPLIKRISDILYDSGESFINDDGVDRKVCDEVASKVIGQCMLQVAPASFEIADLVYNHINSQPHVIRIPDRLPERIQEIFCFGKELNGPKH